MHHKILSPKILQSRLKAAPALSAFTMEELVGDHVTQPRPIQLLGKQLARDKTFYEWRFNAQRGLLDMVGHIKHCQQKTCF